MIKTAFSTTLIILAAIILGTIFGINTDGAPFLSSYVDYLILALVFVVFLDVPLQKIPLAFKQPKVLFIAWLTNFLILPFLGFGLTKLFLPNDPLIAIGLAIYFMSPCTDWFLGFTRMAKGNTALGSVLLPINMITQLLLYPFFVEWFSDQSVASISALEIAVILKDWFLVPAVLAFVIQLLTLKKYADIRLKVASLNNWIIYVLVFFIFSVNVQQIVENLAIFGWVLLTVVVFFLIGLAFTETISKVLKLEKADHILYTITTTARNAPLMLGLTTVALPDEPLIYAAIIIGMLIEFPYLAIQVLRFTAKAD